MTPEPNFSLLCLATCSEVNFTNPGSISSTFYRQLLHQQSYGNPNGARRRAQSLRVERILWPCILVKLGIFLLVKLNRTRRMTTSTFALYIIKLVKQTNGTKSKWASSHSLAPVGAVQFHIQKYAQFYQYAWLENTLNFHTVCFTLYASRIGVILLEQKLPVKC